MVRVVIYTTSYCPYCRGAKELLRAKKVDFEEIDVTHNPDLRREMERRSGRKTVPQIFVDGLPLGGFAEVRLLEAEGKLDAILGIDAQA